MASPAHDVASGPGAWAVPLDREAYADVVLAFRGFGSDMSRVDVEPDLYETVGLPSYAVEDSLERLGDAYADYRPDIGRLPVDPAEIRRLEAAAERLDDALDTVRDLELSAGAADSVPGAGEPSADAAEAALAELAEAEMAFDDALASLDPSCA